MTTVLLADVDPDTRRILGDYLGANGFRVETCETREELLAYVQADSPAAVILELYDFGDESYELVRELRTGREGAPLPVVVFTSSPDSSLLADVEDAGAVVLSKPASPSRVYLVLQALLGEGPPDPADRSPLRRRPSARDRRAEA